MIRKKKRFVRPKKAYETVRIKEENVMMEKYALKNKKEIWKTIAKVDYFRRRAKALARESAEDQEVLFNKLRELGLKINSISDVLALTFTDLLERRLPTIVVKKNLANTEKQARQMVVHKKVLIDGKVINVPSYLVKVSEESLISVRRNQKSEKPKKEEVKVEEQKTPDNASTEVTA